MTRLYRFFGTDSAWSEIILFFFDTNGIHTVIIDDGIDIPGLFQQGVRRAAVERNNPLWKIPAIHAVIPLQILRIRVVTRYIKTQSVKLLKPARHDGEFVGK